MATARAPQPIAEDPVRLDPLHYQVELENEYVRVLRIRYGPREKSVMHSHPNSLAVFLTDQHSRFTLPDGRTEENRFASGHAKWFAADSHLPENLSDKPLEVVLVELKTG